MGGGVALASAALTGIQAISQIAGGRSRQQEYNAQADSYGQQALVHDQQAGIYDQESVLQERQGAIARAESIEAAIQRTREVTKFQSKQAHEIATSGITIGTEGYKSTPVIILEETRRLGQQEVDAILRRGKEQQNLYNQRADITRMSAANERISAANARQSVGNSQKSGRNSLLGGIIGAGGSILEGYISGTRNGVYGNNSSASSSASRASSRGFRPAGGTP